MSDQLIVERGGLEKKDKSELQAIVTALGGTASSRSRKAELIDKILELSGASLPESDDPPQATDGDTGTGESTGADGDTAGSTSPDEDAAESKVAAESTDTEETTDPAPEAEAKTGDDRNTEDDSSAPAQSQGGGRTRATTSTSADGDNGRRNARGANGRKGNDRGSGRGRKAGGGSDAGSHPVGPDGEPLADWELEVMADGETSGAKGSGKGNRRTKGGDNNDAQNKGDGRKTDNRDKGGRDRNDRDKNDEELDPNNRRGRRRGRGRGRDRDDAGNDPISTEPVPVAGSLDLRDEGYGFLRVAGYLPSKEDVYVSVKQVRQYGLRKGDNLTGLSRPANRNEKNPGFHQIDTVNGKPPEEARKRPRFDDLTPLFPDEQLVMSMREEPLNMTTRIIDLVSPIGKGQRGLIVSPPKAGKTTVIKDIARAIETNNPEVRLIVLLVDERPEEVTDMRRSLRNGEVAASTFDRPPEEHCAVAELTIERAKRVVESGDDVVIILDGITRLARAYNLSVPQTGRAMSGGLDAGALYPPKRFLGAARNLEEGGSLTILATALVETGSRMDEVIFEEFKGTGNMELRLDRRLAEKRVYPAVDIDGSSTRNEELLFDNKQLKQAWKLRRVLSGMSDEGTSAAGIEMLIDRLQTFKTNADFLAEIGKAPSV